MRTLAGRICGAGLRALVVFGATLIGCNADRGASVDAPDAEPNADAGDTASIRDADPPDADPPDADSPDADPPDADPPDADPPDADPPDADPPDGAPGDADTDAPPTNACGGTAPLTWQDALAELGERCLCDGALICDGPDALRCDAEACEPPVPFCDGTRTAVVPAATCVDETCQRTEQRTTCADWERCSAGSCMSCGCTETERCDDAGACVAGDIEACTDGVDNNGNGGADCDDADCDGRDGCVLQPWVAQVRVVDGRERIFLGRPGEAAAPLASTLNGDLATHPTWSPDGLHLTWATWDLSTMEQRLRTLDVSTGDVVDLDDDVLGCSVVAWPTYSPDGRSIAFECVSDTSRVDIIDLDTNAVRTAAANAASPWWHLGDADRISFIAQAPLPVGVWDVSLEDGDIVRRVDAVMASRGVVTSDRTVHFTREATLLDGTETTILLDATRALIPSRLESRRVDLGVRVLYYVAADGAEVALHEASEFVSFATVASRGGVSLVTGVLE